MSCGLIATTVTSGTGRCGGGASLEQPAAASAARPAPRQAKARSGAKVMAGPWLLDAGRSAGRTLAGSGQQGCEFAPKPRSRARRVAEDQAHGGPRRPGFRRSRIARLRETEAMKPTRPARPVRRRWPALLVAAFSCAAAGRAGGELKPA